MIDQFEQIVACTDLIASTVVPAGTICPLQTRVLNGSQNA